MSNATTSERSEGRSEGSRRTLRAHRAEIRDASRELARSTRSTLSDIVLAWRLQAERNPYLSLGAAFAAGYVLGGGVPVRLVRFAVGTGARMAATMALREVLAGSLDLSAFTGARESNGSQRRTAGAGGSGSGARG
jgi:hypothetical protein